MDIVREGRKTGEFERKTPLDETVMAIYLVMLPYLHPLLLQTSSTTPRRRRRSCPTWCCAACRPEHGFVCDY